MAPHCWILITAKKFPSSDDQKNASIDDHPSKILNSSSILPDFFESVFGGWSFLDFGSRAGETKDRETFESSSDGTRREWKSREGASVRAHLCPSLVKRQRKSVNQIVTGLGCLGNLVFLHKVQGTIAYFRVIFWHGRFLLVNERNAGWVIFLKK